MSATARASRARAANPDAELILTCAQHVINMNAYNNTPSEGGLDGDGGPLWAAYGKTRDAISNAKPKSLEGVLAKARAALAENADADPCFHGMEGQWAWEVMNDLLRLANKSPDAKLIAMANEYADLEATYRRTSWADDPSEERPGRAEAEAELGAALARQAKLAPKLIAAKPTTLDGARAKARAAVSWFSGDGLVIGEGGDILWSLATSLAGEA